MSISQNFPDEGPTLNLNFAGSKVLDPRITFIRSSVGTYMDANGLVVTASADSPRFDHRYVNGEIESLGLLVEEQRVNYCVNSTGSSNWSNPNGLTKSASKTVTAPTGETDAYEWTETTASGTHLNNGPTITISSGSSYSISAFFKQVSGSGRGFLLQWYKSGGQTVKVSYVPSTDTTYISNSGGASAPTNVSVVTYPNGWYKISFTAALAETSALSIVGSTDGSGNASYTGSTSNSFSFWGLQYEQASFSTSYIPTSGSTKTRSPDNVSMTGTNFSDWFNSSEGTLYVRANTDAGAGLRGVAAINRPSNYADDRVDIRYDQSNNSRANFNNSSLARTSGFNFYNPKFILSYGENYRAYGINADITQSTSSFTPSTNVDTLIIGNFDAGTNYYLCGTISQLTYYPTRLSNTVLQNVTK